MNKSVIADELFRVWIKLPHCRIIRNKHFADVRSRFDYTNNSDISIVAANCLGGDIYYLLGLKFNSPFINTSMDRKEYIKLVSRFSDYMAYPIEIKRTTMGSCEGTLGGGILEPVHIRFPHDADVVKVKEKWALRSERINYKKLVLICDDKGLDVGDYKEFEKIPAYRKILFTANDHSMTYPSCYQLKKYAGEKRTGEYNGKSLTTGLWKFALMWDYVDFLNGESSV